MIIKYISQIFKKRLNMFKKDFIYLGLDKKKMKKFRACFDKFIKVISFIIFLLHFSQFIDIMY